MFHLLDYDHESGVPVVPDDFEETKDEDSTIYTTPKQNLEDSSARSVRRSSRIQAQTPTDNNKTPEAIRVSAPEEHKTVGTPQRVMTPKSNKIAPHPQRVPAPKTATPKAERVLTPKSTRSKRYSEPVTPNPRPSSGKEINYGNTQGRCRCVCVKYFNHDRLRQCNHLFH